MPKIYCLKCYVTRPQYEKIKQDAKINGNRTISDYVRSTLLGNGVFLQQKITENNKILKRVELILAKNMVCERKMQPEHNKV